MPVKNRTNDWLLQSQQHKVKGLEEELSAQQIKGGAQGPEVRRAHTFLVNRAAVAPCHYVKLTSETALLSDQCDLHGLFV